MALPEQIEARLRALGANPADVEERFIRGAGPGGQKINKTSSTVWLRHRPSGIEVRCQRERSQTANRELAWAELCGRLEQRANDSARQRQAEFEKNRRQKRQKSRTQKIRMVESKRFHAKQKANRERIKEW